MGWSALIWLASESSDIVPLIGLCANDIACASLIGCWVVRSPWLASGLMRLMRWSARLIDCLVVDSTTAPRLVYSPYTFVADALLNQCVPRNFRYQSNLFPRFCVLSTRAFFLFEISCPIFLSTEKIILYFIFFNVLKKRCWASITYNVASDSMIRSSPCE